MPANIVEGFSLSHAEILGEDGLAEEFGDIYGIRSGSLELDSDEYDNTGDDAILSTWYWGNKATVTVQGGYIPFETISLISGSAVTTTTDAAAPADATKSTFEIPLWEENSMNTKPRSMRIRIPSKDSDGNIRTLDMILYKVQFQPITFDGPSYKEGLLVNYNGSALFSSTDERGEPVVDSRTGEPTKAIGRLVSAPFA